MPAYIPKQKLSLPFCTHLRRCYWPFVISKMKRSLQGSIATFYSKLMLRTWSRKWLKYSNTKSVGTMPSSMFTNTIFSASMLARTPLTRENASKTSFVWSVITCPGIRRRSRLHSTYIRFFNCFINLILLTQIYKSLIVQISPNTTKCGTRR